jgi:hypothetical protein
MDGIRSRATAAGMLAEYAAADVTEFVPIPAGDEPDQYDRLAEVRELVR